MVAGDWRISAGACGSASVVSGLTPLNEVLGEVAPVDSAHFRIFTSITDGSSANSSS